MIHTVIKLACQSLINVNCTIHLEDVLSCQLLWLTDKKNESSTWVIFTYQFLSIHGCLHFSFAINVLISTIPLVQQKGNLVSFDDLTQKLVFKLTSSWLNINLEKSKVLRIMICHSISIMVIPWSFLINFICPIIRPGALYLFESPIRPMNNLYISS